MRKIPKLKLLVILFAFSISIALVLNHSGSITFCVPITMMVTESMASAIEPGDWLYVDCFVPYDKLRIGDIVEFQTPVGITAHRIIGLESDAMITKGDNNLGQDYATSKEKYLGRTTYVLKSGLLGFMIIPAALCCVLGTYVVIKKYRRVAQA